MPGKQHISNLAKRFCSIKEASELASLLRKDLFQLELMTLNPRYEHFFINKPHGGFREIEDPNRILKAQQTKLNEYLQCCYYLIRPDCVHGFTISANREEPRTILTNARAHINCKYLVKLDFSDFFHQIDAVRLDQMFENQFPGFEKELCKLLNGLFLYKGRLAMGAPTSPVLSNFAMLETDGKLMDFTHSNQLNYTRYADDLCFSSEQEIGSALITGIKDILSSFNYKLNPDKFIVYQPEEEKQITGLIIENDLVTLPHDYLPKLEKEVNRFRVFCEVESRYHMIAKRNRMHHFEQELRGKINFAETILPECEPVLKLSETLDQAKELLDHSESVSWLERPYGFFHK
ncbi:MAG: reverse transcriptase family protein [Saprospiraceae bacterium]